MAAESAPRTARDFARIELTRSILAEGRRQLSQVGPGELSLRAVARELGMASSAVYRYFPSRDHLISALLIEGYNELGAAVEAADAGESPTRLTKRMRAVLHAVRDWANANFHEYALLFGSPIPGYVAPDDTILPAQRVPIVLLRILSDADAAGLPLGSPSVPIPRAEKAAIAPVRVVVDGPLSDERLVRAVMAFSTLIGAISLELFGHLVNGVIDYDTHFDHVVDRMVADLGLR
jgi:AcrR family transcriptional regulator